MQTAAELAELDFWNDNALFGIADRRRMRDISFVSMLLVFMKQGIQEDVRNSNLNTIYDLYNDNYPSKHDDAIRFKGVLNQINKIIDGNSERIKILRRQVHLYSLFTAIYEITIDEQELTDNAVTNYRDFVDNYENDEVLNNYFSEIISDIYHYKSLAKEGTRDKGNRLGRHSSIKLVLNAVRP